MAIALPVLAQLIGGVGYLGLQQLNTRRATRAAATRQQVRNDAIRQGLSSAIQTLPDPTMQELVSATAVYDPEGAQELFLKFQEDAQAQANWREEQEVREAGLEIQAQRAEIAAETLAETQNQNRIDNDRTEADRLRTIQGLTDVTGETARLKAIEEGASTFMQPVQTEQGLQHVETPMRGTQAYNERRAAWQQSQEALANFNEVRETLIRSGLTQNPGLIQSRRMDALLSSIRGLVKGERFLNMGANFTGSEAAILFDQIPDSQSLAEAWTSNPEAVLSAMEVGSRILERDLEQTLPETVGYRDVEELRGRTSDALRRSNELNQYNQMKAAEQEYIRGLQAEQAQLGGTGGTIMDWASVFLPGIEREGAGQRLVRQYQIGQQLQGSPLQGGQAGAVGRAAADNPFAAAGLIGTLFGGAALGRGLRR